jgi:hypothetical protein
METVLAALHEDVIWANGMEGGHVHGREEVRSYWKRRCAMVDPHVEPGAFCDLYLAGSDSQAPHVRAWVDTKRLASRHRAGPQEPFWGVLLTFR